MRRERTDVMVVGGGPAGLAAARAAARAGRAVRLCDDNPRLGGQIWRHDARRGTGPHASVPPRDELKALGVVHRPGTTIVDACAPTQLWTHDDGELVLVEAERVVLATGARERLLPFPGWTRPGVFGVGGLQALAKSGVNVRGQRVVVAGTGPLLLAVAKSLQERGAEVLRVLEQASVTRFVRFGLSLWSTPAKLWQGLSLTMAAPPLRLSSWVTAAEGDDDGPLRQVVVHGASGTAETIPCELLACGYGLTPRTRLARLLGCAVEDTVTVDDLQRTTVPNVLAAGESCGIGGEDKALVEGEIAGLVAAGRQSEARALMPRRDRWRTFARRLARDFALRDELRELATDDTIVCRCEDVPLSAVRDLDDARETKLATRCGMGPCQGRVCQPALRFLLGHGHDRPRPPLMPVPLGILAELSHHQGTPP